MDKISGMKGRIGTGVYLLALAALCACGGHSKQAPKVPEPPPPKALTLAPERALAEVKNLGKDPEGCTWIETEASVVVGEQESRHQARAAAIDKGRARAMSGFLGVKVTSKFMLFEQEGLKDQERLTEDLLQTTRQGLIIKERIIASGYQNIPGCQECRFGVRLKVCLLPLPDSSDAGFRVELGISRVTFVEGDHAAIFVTPNRDSYIYLYNVSMDNDAVLIVPNEMLPKVHVKAGETWEYPGPDMKKRGVSLEAQLPRGNTNISAETIKVIAAKSVLPKKLTHPAIKYPDLLRRVHASKAEWTEDTQAFTIHKK